MTREAALARRERVGSVLLPNFGEIVMRHLASLPVASNNLGESCRLSDLPVGLRASAQAVHFTSSLAKASGNPVLGVLLRFDRPVRTVAGNEATAVWLNVNWQQDSVQAITAARMTALGATPADFDVFPETGESLSNSDHEAIVAWAERFRNNRVALRVVAGQQGREPFTFLNRLAGAPVAPAAPFRAAAPAASSEGFSDDNIPF